MRATCTTNADKISSLAERVERGNWLYMALSDALKVAIKQETVTDEDLAEYWRIWFLLCIEPILKSFTTVEQVKEWLERNEKDLTHFIWEVRGKKEQLTEEQKKALEEILAPNTNGLNARTPQEYLKCQREHRDKLDFFLKQNRRTVCGFILKKISEVENSETPMKRFKEIEEKITSGMDEEITLAMGAIEIPLKARAEYLENKINVNLIVMLWTYMIERKPMPRPEKQIVANDASQKIDVGLFFEAIFYPVREQIYNVAMWCKAARHVAANLTFRGFDTNQFERLIDTVATMTTYRFPKELSMCAIQTVFLKNLRETSEKMMSDTAILNFEQALRELKNIDISHVLVMKYTDEERRNHEKTMKEKAEKRMKIIEKENGKSAKVGADTKSNPTCGGESANVSGKRKSDTDEVMSVAVKVRRSLTAADEEKGSNNNTVTTAQPSILSAENLNKLPMVISEKPTVVAAPPVDALKPKDHDDNRMDVDQEGRKDNSANSKQMFTPIDSTTKIAGLGVGLAQLCMKKPNNPPKAQSATMKIDHAVQKAAAANPKSSTGNPKATVNAAAPKATVNAPKAPVNAPKASVNAPKATVNAPKAAVNAPKATVNAPKSSANAPKSSVGVPKPPVSVPKPPEAVSVTVPKPPVSVTVPKPPATVTVPKAPVTVSVPKSHIAVMGTIIVLDSPGPSSQGAVAQVGDVKETLLPTKGIPSALSAEGIAVSMGDASSKTKELTAEEKIKKEAKEATERIFGGKRDKENWIRLCATANLLGNADQSDTQGEDGKQKQAPLTNIIGMIDDVWQKKHELKAAGPVAKKNTKENTLTVSLNKKNQTPPLPMSMLKIKSVVYAAHALMKLGQRSLGVTGNLEDYEVPASFTSSYNSFKAVGALMKKISAGKIEVTDQTVKEENQEILEEYAKYANIIESKLKEVTRHLIPDLDMVISNVKEDMKNDPEKARDILKKSDISSWVKIKPLAPEIWAEMEAHIKAVQAETRLSGFKKKLTRQGSC